MKVIFYRPPLLKKKKKPKEKKKRKLASVKRLPACLSSPERENFHFYTKLGQQFT